ncbi:hypothetical protein M427DRAFT_70885 [Gonapodya prolifera JEL478]|uniref:SURP motif domain-containing protein n=1 Tax=Gonapodya prolifera (strain JEL478) TaxID=1344416 RepID=A0A139AB49_GONPJ|nr:hypothetical protein M427DRAFT_70885 [Gonapodya prolifera JEL478]|eukprot:KXS13967.1 hypothetical protein M427DRAFT_70885 [Gonapodya prolifera JEL478]
MPSDTEYDFDEIDDDEVADSKRKRKRRRVHRHNDNRSDADPASLIALGYGSRIFQNDETVSLIASGGYMVPWRGDSSLMVDRGLPPRLCLAQWDVRNLLDSLSSLATHDQTVAATGDEETFAFHSSGYGTTAPPQPEYDDEEDRACDEERYRDVDPEEEMLLGEFDDDERKVYLEERERRWAEAASKRTEAEAKKVDEQQSQGDGSDAWLPPGVAPPSPKHRALIHRTAKFISSSTTPAQTELVLRVKQASNPRFAFLADRDPLHEYYRGVRRAMEMGVWDYAEEGGEDGVGAAGGGKKGGGRGAVALMKVAEGAPTEADLALGAAPSLDNVDGALDQSSLLVRTAAHVARHGPLFEAKLRERNASDERFAFLNPWKALHATYLQEKSKFVEDPTREVETMSGRAAGPPDTSGAVDALQDTEQMSAVAQPASSTPPPEVLPKSSELHLMTNTTEDKPQKSTQGLLGLADYSSDDSDDD